MGNRGARQRGQGRSDHSEVAHAIGLPHLAAFVALCETTHSQVPTNPQEEHASFTDTPTHLVDGDIAVQSMVAASYVVSSHRRLGLLVLGQD